MRILLAGSHAAGAAVHQQYDTVEHQCAHRTGDGLGQVCVSLGDVAQVHHQISLCWQPDI